MGWAVARLRSIMIGLCNLLMISTVDERRIRRKCLLQTAYDYFFNEIISN